MSYITVSELREYKIGFDLSGYAEAELETNLLIADDIINDYIGYIINYDPVIEEQGTVNIPYDNKLLINVNSTFVDTISELKLYNGATYEVVDISAINLFQGAGYFYLQSSYCRNYSQNTLIHYKVSYTKVDKGISDLIKLATAKIVGNLLRADYNNNNGVAGNDGKIQGFTSGDYTVKIGGSSLSYKGKYNNTGGAVNNPFIDDSVKALLYKFKRTKQNTY